MSSALSLFLHIQQSVAARIKSIHKLTALGLPSHVLLTEAGFDTIGISKGFALHGADAAGYDQKFYPCGARLQQRLS